MNDIQNKGLPLPFTDTRLSLPVKGITSVPSKEDIQKAVYYKELTAPTTDLTGLQNAAATAQSNLVKHTDDAISLKAASDSAKNRLDAFDKIDTSSLVGADTLAAHTTRRAALEAEKTAASNAFKNNEDKLLEIKKDALEASKTLSVAESQAAKNERAYNKLYTEHMVNIGVLPKSALKPYENDPTKVASVLTNTAPIPLARFMNTNKDLSQLPLDTLKNLLREASTVREGLLKPEGSATDKYVKAIEKALETKKKEKQ